MGILLYMIEARLPNPNVKENNQCSSLSTQAENMDLLKVYSICSMSKLIDRL
jgi:hypothetical protein